MLPRTPPRVRVFFHRRGKDPESAWCTPLGTADHYRLDNIDYPEARQRAPLGAFLRRRFDAESEGCFAPGKGQPGRLYVAVPRRFAAKTVFEAAAAKFEGLVAIVPALRSGTKAPVARRPAPRGSEVVDTAPPTLFDAIRRNDEAAFARVKRADLAIVDERQRPLLFRAVLEGRTAMVQRLVALGAELNPRRLSPLYAAAMRDRPKEARLLMDAGARPESAVDKEGDPVLVTAAFYENAAVLRVLLTAPHTTAVKSLALLEAAGVGNLAIVKLLVKAGADPAWKSSRGNSALSIARKRKRAEVVEYLASLGGRAS